MRYQDILKTSFRNLKHAKLRSLLTILGIVIGVSAVIILISIGTSAQNYLLNLVRGVGSNLIFVIPGASSSGRFGTSASSLGVKVTTLKEIDVEVLKKEPSVNFVSPLVNGVGTITYLNKNIFITYQGVGENYFEITNFKVEKGRKFQKSDIDSYARVILIGNNLAKELFEGDDPLGKIVRLNNIPFQVIGVMEKKGVGFGGINQDDIALLPIKLAQSQLLGIDYYNFIYVEANANYNIDFVKERVKDILRQTHNIPSSKVDDFTVRTQEDVLSLLTNITSIMKIFLTIIASVSLLVGGIGIMNIMLVSVMERTREIGLRKAVGAKTKDILKQFLFEASFLTFLGGIFGIILGFLVSYLSALIISKFFKLEDWVFVMPLKAILLGAGVSILIGIVFGFYPAKKAAEKNPIEALRYD